MHFDKFHAKSISIQVSGNTAYATIVGSIPPAYFIKSIDVSRNEYCSEIVVYLDKANTEGQVNAQVMHDVKKQVTLGSFNPGKYCARINKKNDVVEWFEI